MANDDGIPQWLLDENEARTPAYKKDVDDERFLFRMNAALEPLELALPADGPTSPIFMFFGMPRCGKTFFSQVVNYCLDMGYPNNLAARFWRAPVHGMRLARMLDIHIPDTDFTSDYGKTGALSDPHDFHYFWQHQFRIDTLPYDAVANSARIDWPAVGRQLSRMSAFWGRPALMKSIEVSYHMREVVAAYPKAVMVFMERDYIDCAASLLKGRRDNFGSENAWYGQVPLPEDYNNLLRRPWHEQIGGQFRSLLDMYEAQFADLPEHNVLRLRYSDLCADPNGVMDTLIERAAALGATLERRQRIDPAHVRFSTGKGAPEDLGLLAQGLEAFGLPERL